MMRTSLSFLSSLFILVFPVGQTAAQISYQRPPEEMAALIAAPATPRLTLSPMKDCFVLATYRSMPSIREMASEEISFAGNRLLPATNGPRVSKKFLSLEVKALYRDKKSPKNDGIKQGFITGLPDFPILSYRFDPCRQYLIILLETGQALELWIAPLATLEARKVTERHFNAAFLSDVVWAPDGQSFIFPATLQNRTRPQPDLIPGGPVIQETAGKAAPVRTYQNLLKNSYDELLFNYYGTSELIEVSLTGGGERIVCPAALYTAMKLSPDGKYLLTAKVHPPYSYAVPSQFFPADYEVYDVAAARRIKDVYRSPLIESLPSSLGSTRPGIRGIAWRADRDATLMWIEALDGGDGKRPSDLRDALWTIEAPFVSDPRLLLRTPYRLQNIFWGDETHAFLSMNDRPNSRNYVAAFNPSVSESELSLLFSLHREDKYADPGRLLLMPDAKNRVVVYSDDRYRSVYLTGPGYGPEGARPFIDRLDLSTLKTVRLWQSSAAEYQNPVHIIDPRKGIFIYTGESSTRWPDYYLCNLKTGKTVPITRFENPYKGLEGISRQTVEYTRADGVSLSGTLYLPAGYKKEDGPLPVMMWAYPAEFKSARNAGQRTGSPNTFVRIKPTGIIPLVTRGYAIFDDVSFPIVGEGDREPNDTYVEQLILNAEAAIDILVDMGVADRNRIAIGGHSYGAFMTANLLANCDLFAAGIARSGAHNRSLTPFGFQNERRTFWEAKEVYMRMSPFFFADRLKTPILFIHGLADNNTGTFTIQSERMFAAVKGNGGTARLVLLPCESHGYAAEESVMHQAWEILQWLDKYVKNR